jgi:hypothetical protein
MYTSRAGSARLPGNRSPTWGHLIAKPMLRPAPYLSQKLTRPIPTKDGGTLRTVLDARTYVLALSEDREMRQQWQRACELLLAEADVGALSIQIELALFYDGRLVLT